MPVALDLVTRSLLEHDLTREGGGSSQTHTSSSLRIDLWDHPKATFVILSHREEPALPHTHHPPTSLSSWSYPISSVLSAWIVFSLASH